MPKPTAIRRRDGNPGKRGYNHAEPVPPEGLPDCPPHLSALAREEWERVAAVLHEMGVLTVVDRAALAAYCQSYARWAEAEEMLKATPVMLKTPSGYVQQSPWLSVANKQLELMGRYMAELGITPASRSRVAAYAAAESRSPYEFRILFEAPDGTVQDQDGNHVTPEEASRASIAASCEGAAQRRCALSGRMFGHFFRHLRLAVQWSAFRSTVQFAPNLDPDAGQHRRCSYGAAHHVLRLTSRPGRACVFPRSQRRRVPDRIMSDWSRYVSNGGMS